MNIDWDIVDEIIETVEFYIDAHDRYTLYAEYKKAKKCLEFYPVDSDDFESYIRVMYRNHSKKRNVPNVRHILEYIKDEAIYYEDLPAITPSVRIAGNIKDGIEYFLADRLHHVVKVTEHGWEISKTPQNKFLSTTSFEEQVVPAKSEESLLDLLRPLVNLRGDDLLLFAIWLVQAFSSGSHYGIMLSAERGSGKSSLTRLISRIIDPSEIETTIMQTKLDDFQNYLANHYLATFDNVREIPTEYSDTLCAAITGTTVAKRRLFKDRDEVRLKLHNTVVINGIGIFPKESDLAERFLLFKLEKIKSVDAKSDYDLAQLLNENRPFILGCIFDILAKASGFIKGLNPSNPTRMTGAYKDMLAIALALGLSEADFHKIISDNIAKMEHAHLGSPIVQAVCEYMMGPMSGKRKVTEPSTVFHENVKTNYSGNKTELYQRAAEFSKALKNNCEKLMKAGFSSLVDDTGAGGSTITIIRDKK